MKKYLLLSLAMAVALPAYAALNCTKPPTCAELGYKQTASNCVEQLMLKCPFDETAVFCGGEDLEAKCKNAGYGYYDTTGSDQCITNYVKEGCPYSASYYKCRELTAQEKCEGLGFQQIACMDGYYAFAKCDLDNSYIKCAKDVCSLGYLPGSEEACACEHGSKANGTTSTSGKACQTCCKSTETCVTCATLK